MKNFSVLNLILVVALICFGLTVFLQKSKYERLSAETELLRQEVGHFEIHDENMVYVREVKPKYRSRWRFELYLPESIEFEYGVGEVRLTEEGTIDFNSIETMSTGIPVRRKFEFIDFPLRGKIAQSVSLGSYSGELHYWMDSFSRSPTHASNWSNPHISSGFTQHNTSQLMNQYFSPDLLWDIAPRFGSATRESRQHGKVYELEFNQPLVLAMLDLHNVTGLRNGRKPQEVYVFALIPKNKSKRFWSMNDIPSTIVDGDSSDIK